MAGEKKKKKGSYGKVLGYCTAVGCTALLVAWLFGDGIGFGLGGPGGGSNGGNGTNGGYSAPQDETYHVVVTPGGQDEPDDQQQEDTAIPEPEVPVLIIRVVNSDIYHGDDAITLDDLGRLFDDINQPGFLWELHDEYAIMEHTKT